MSHDSHMWMSHDSHIWMSHVTHMWMSLGPQIWMSHVTHMNESCHKYAWVMSQIWNESCHKYEWVVSHIWMRRVTHIDKPRHTREWVMSHKWARHVTTEVWKHIFFVGKFDIIHELWRMQTSHVHINGSCHTYEWVMCDLRTCNRQYFWVQFSEVNINLYSPKRTSSIFNMLWFCERTPHAMQWYVYNMHWSTENIN